MSKPSGTESLTHNAAALEDLFFAKRDALLLKKKKEEASLEERKKSLRENTKFSTETIDELVSLGIDHNTLKIVCLIPLLQVAWADGYIDRKETESILRAAHAEGIEDDSAEIELLELWLQEKPDQSLFQAWRDLTADSIKNLANEDVQILKTQVLKISRKVAEAAGGFLGFGSISDVEQAVINEIESSFER